MLADFAQISGMIRRPANLDLSVTAPMTRLTTSGRQQYGLQTIEVDWFDEVLVEARFERPPTVRLLPVAGDRNQSN